MPHLWAVYPPRVLSSATKSQLCYHPDGPPPEDSAIPESPIISGLARKPRDGLGHQGTRVLSSGCLPTRNGLLVPKGPRTPLRLPSDFTDPEILSISTLSLAPQQHGWHLGLGHPGPRSSVSAFCPLAQSQLESRQTRGHSLPSPLPVSLAMTSSPRSWTTPHLSRERVCVLGGRVAENHCGPTGQWHPPGLSVVVMAPLGP